MEGRAAASDKGMASLPYPPSSQGRAGLGKHDSVWWCQASLRATLVGGGGLGASTGRGPPRHGQGMSAYTGAGGRRRGESRTMRTSVGEEMRRFPFLCSPQGSPQQENPGPKGGSEVLLPPIL